MFQTTAYYYVLSTAAVLIFLIGVMGNLAFWLGGGPAVSRRARLSWFLRKAPVFILNRRTLWAFLSQVLLQTQVWRRGRLQWLMSVCLTWGTLELFFIGSLGDMFRDYGLASLSKDEPWFALTNEVGGLMLGTGVAIALYRRWVLRLPQLGSNWEDSLVLIWLALIAATGYLTEAGRLLSEGVPQGQAAYSFVGQALSRLGPGWGGIYPYLWWLHAGLSFSLVAYIPYSKLFHIIAGPLSIMARSAEPIPQGGSLHGVR
ncbi:MAG: respiratory nitrate reductase subunit gamma [Chloroflexota bacterium]|nr:respiratory nitrate reductase subunit gamma [Chloroflexota bacterium]